MSIEITQVEKVILKTGALDDLVVSALKSDMETLMRGNGQEDEFYAPMLKLISYYLSDKDFDAYMKEHQKQLDSWIKPKENYN